MSDEEYSEWVDKLPNAEARVEAIMRESRFVTAWFPAYSSGAGDLIADLLDDLRTEWANEAASPEEVD